MFTFCVALVALVVGYLLYGAFVERVFGVQPERTTPCHRLSDGVDYIPLPTWRVYLIQFLNIAGTGPIFGAIMGILFGPAAYLWIVFGCIFMGAVHDYLCGMISLRKDGASLPEMVGDELGTVARQAMRVLSIVLLVLVGTVFVTTSAGLLATMSDGALGYDVMQWKTIFLLLVFLYCVLATLLPIDALIGRLYPIFGAALLVMAIGVGFGIFTQSGWLPEITDAPFQSHHPKGLSIFPFLCITIACGAISGFHATQSPMMARCMKSEKLGRPVFYGAMITEGLVALVWAAVSSYFFFDGGAAEVGSDLSAAAPTVVTKISNAWLGVFGGILAILGVVAAPITTGDTALRSARLTLAEALRLDQKPLGNRLKICIPLFAVVCLLIWYNIADENGFNTIWRYFGWANQTLSIFTLWAITVYLAKNKGKLWYMIAEIPAIFMTVVCLTYIFTQKIGFGLPLGIGLGISLIIVVILNVVFFVKVLAKRN